VLAIDGQEEAIDRLLRRPVLPSRERLETRVARFDDVAFPDAELVNSSYALPFCPPDSFPGLWRRAESSLCSGGRFSGHLFGERDGWSDRRDMTFHTRAEVESLLEGFEVERLDEVEEDGTTAVGTAKHWHLFHVVAHKR
jgi:hypothetical protein